MPQPETKRKKVIIVGGGFAGLNAAKKFGQKGQALDIVLLDRRNYHLFQPLLYQVATAGLSPGDIATPLRTVLSEYPNIKVLLCEVKGVDLAHRTVDTDIGPQTYDYLVMACGAQHSYFGHEEWETYAPGLKTVEQATEIRRRILLAFEKAERESNPEDERALLTFVIVGGGPTGVELAGTIGELTRFTLSKDFRHIDPRRARIILIEAGPRILATFDPELIQRAMSDLEKAGVTIWTNTRVTGINADGVQLGKETVNSHTVIWAAGVKPSLTNTTLKVPLDKGGRVLVGSDWSLPGYPEAFVLGDQACFMQNGKSLPGLAPVAMQAGRYAAETIIAEQKGKKRKPFHYLDKGQMATIGRSKAVLQMGKIKFGGYLAWLAWLVVHIFYLIGFRNRILVLIQWFWAYATYKKGSQLIVNKEWRSFDVPPNPTAAPAAHVPGSTTTGSTQPLVAKERAVPT